VTTRAAIFDLDGLLIDSEPLWVRAEMQVFAEVGCVLCEDDCALTKGLRTDDVVAYWNAKHPFEGAAEKVVEERLIARVAELIGTEGRALPGIAHAIDVARREGLSLALASSSPPLVIDAALGRLGLRETFAVVQSAHGLAYGKPHPEIFLLTAQRLNVSALECVVFEDSLTGLVAAKAARMRCIAVPFDWPEHDARFALADHVVGSLADVAQSFLKTM
jgi:sugar-phosphatase